jgi:hypothetical protein
MFKILKYEGEEILSGYVSDEKIQKQAYRDTFHYLSKINNQMFTVSTKFT